MTSKVTNSDLMSTLLDIKEDIGSLKSTTALQLEGLKNHSTRIATLEDGAARQKGSAKVWGLIATAAGTIAGAVCGIKFGR